MSRRQASLWALSIWLGMTLSSSAWADLENLYSFDDPDNVTVDSSGNGRDGFLDDLEVGWVNDDVRGGVLGIGRIDQRICCCPDPRPQRTIHDHDVGLSRSRLVLRRWRGQ